VSRGAVALASLLVTLGRPAWWVLALAAFLARGGLLLFLVPIVAIPSPLAVSNAFGPLIVPLALGRIGPEAVVLIVVAVAVLLAWLLIGWSVAAAAERALIREAAEAAAEEGLTGRGEPRSPARGGEAVGRILAARLVVLVPLLAVIAWGSIGIVEAAYVELTRPLEVATPLAVRVAAGAAWQVIAIAVAWLLGEIVGGAASRWIVIDGASAGGGLVTAAREVIRRPASTVVPWLVTTAIVAVALGALLVAAAVAWQTLQVAMVDPAAAPLSIAVSLVAFVGIWFAGLAIAGLLAAVRTVTGVIARALAAGWVPHADGTFGVGAHRRPGDWSVGDGGGSL